MKKILTLLFTVTLFTTYAIEPTINLVNITDTTSTSNTNTLLNRSIGMFDNTRTMIENSEDSLATSRGYLKASRSEQRSSVILTGGIRFFQMSEGASEISTGYNIELLVEKKRNKFILSYGIGFNSSGGQISDMKLVRHNVRVPIGVGLDLFNHSFLGHPQPVKLVISPYGQYAMSSSHSDQFERWNIGTKASLALELGFFDLGVHYDMILFNQSKIHNNSSFNRSFGIDLSWRFFTMRKFEVKYTK